MCDRKEVVSSLSPVAGDEETTQSDQVEGDGYPDDLSIHLGYSSTLEIPPGNSFPRYSYFSVPADIQHHAFCSLPRCRAPSAAHRGPILCRPEAGDELRGRGRGLPPERRQCAHLRL